VTTISEVSCAAFQYEKFLKKYGFSGNKAMLLGMALRKA